MFQIYNYTKAKYQTDVPVCFALIKELISQNASETLREPGVGKKV